jgi:tetratricopeptide (TPR) repeat protein
MRAAWFLLPLLWISPTVHRAEQSKPAPPQPADPAAALSDAQTLYRKGSFDQAIARFNDVLRADPASGDAYAGMLRSYLKQDKVAEADEVLGKALQATPSHPDLRVAEGELLFRQGQILEAGKLFDEVISSPPIGAAPNPRAYLGAARVADTATLYERENTLIRRAHDLDSSDPDIRKMWMRILSTDARLQSLEDYLSQPSTSDDDDTRRRLREQASFLKASLIARSARCRPVSDVTAIKTTLTSVSLGNGVTASGLDVEIDGKSARLLLDTGASGILISSKLAAQAGLKTVSDIQISGIGDRPDSPAHLAYANAVRIGDMQFSNCPVEVADRVPATSDGIIGTDVFSQFLIDLDFPNSRLQLSELPRRPGEARSKPSLNLGADNPTAAEETNSSAGAASKQSPEAATINSTGAQAEDRYVAPEMHNYVQAFRIDHMLLVPTKINEGAKKLFLIDTGAFDNTITPNAAKEVTKVHRAPRRDVRGMNGEVKKVYVADRVTLDFGHLRQTVPDMIAFDMSRISRQSGVEISGTLGMVMLTMLHVRLDYRDALVDFQYSPKPARR